MTFVARFRYAHWPFVCWPMSLLQKLKSPGQMSSTVWYAASASGDISSGTFLFLFAVHMDLTKETEREATSNVIASHVLRARRSGLPNMWTRGNHLRECVYKRLSVPMSVPQETARRSSLGFLPLSRWLPPSLVCALWYSSSLALGSWPMC